MTPRVEDVPGWGRMTIYVCSSCGEDIAMGPVEKSAGWPAIVDPASITRQIIGDPPRCYDCRSRPT